MIKQGTIQSGGIKQGTIQGAIKQGVLRELGNKPACPNADNRKPFMPGFPHNFGAQYVVSILP